MRHAEWLIGRVLYLEGKPIVSKLNPIKIGATVPEMMALGRKAEQFAIRDYNAGIKLAREVLDQGTADLLIKILKDEEEHEECGASQLDQMEQMGLEGYLSIQTEGATA
jgi:bacterioferritin